MASTRIYYTLDAKCEHNCRGCYLETQKDLPARSPDLAAEQVSTLMSQGFDVRVTGSNLVRYPSIDRIVDCCKQDYLLGDSESISKDRDVMKTLQGKGIQRIFLTSPLSFLLANPDTISIEEAVDAVKLTEIEPILSYVLGRPNRANLRRMIDECLKLGVRSMRFMRYMPTLGEAQDLFITDDELPPFLDEVHQFRESIPKSQLNIHVHGHFGTWFRKDRGPICFAGENLFIIGLDDNVYPCEFLMYPEYVLGRWDGSKLNITRQLKGLSNYDCKLKQMFVDGKEFLLEE